MRTLVKNWFLTEAQTTEAIATNDRNRLGRAQADKAEHATAAKLVATDKLGLVAIIVADIQVVTRVLGADRGGRAQIEGEARGDQGLIRQVAQGHLVADDVGISAAAVRDPIGAEDLHLLIDHDPEDHVVRAFLEHLIDC